MSDVKPSREPTLEDIRNRSVDARVEARNLQELILEVDTILDKDLYGDATKVPINCGTAEKAVLANIRFDTMKFINETIEILAKTQESVRQLKNKIKNSVK